MSKVGSRLISAAKEARQIARGDKQPVHTFIPADIDVKSIRQKTGVSQEDFEPCNVWRVWLRREVDRFLCQSDDGEEFTVIIWQRFTIHRSWQGPTKELPGTKDATLADGRHVNFVGGAETDTFQILDTDQIIRRV